MIGIVNYGLGNLGSIKNMLTRLGHASEIINDPEDLKRASKIILPGVGSFDSGMNFLKNGGWVDILHDLTQKKRVPTLGICLGMQLMTKCSEEGIEMGLGWIDGTVIRFPEGELRIPHMGWNTVVPSNENIFLVNKDVDEKDRFYFVHSYYVKLNDKKLEAGYTDYGIRFTSAFQKDNIFGVQFHPEKSHKFGKELLRIFCEQKNG
ncbi:MAG: imidazole glycerol phosphate synthase subunit HisH [Cyclobacteriaceae bacterium]|nr:imidazole glycerol phosphate synthase subunit HisH [Cyclobacteriaceae bacterium]